MPIKLLGNTVFSIIVPIYNVEQYLDKCILSIRNQSFDNFELLLIDDGSTDNSLMIAQEHAKSDSRIQVVSKINEGQGLARNAGLRMASGDYIMFVDSDDWIDLALCADVFRAFQENDADFLNFGLDFISESGHLVKTMSVFSCENLFSPDIFCNAMLDVDIFSSPCNKIYKRQFIEDNQIRFPELRKYEDPVFSKLVAKFAKKTLFLSKVYYHVLVRENSTTRKISSQSLFDLGLLLEVLRSDVIDVNNIVELNLYKAYTLKLLAGFLIQSAYRIRSSSDYILCFSIVRQYGFYNYMAEDNVLSVLPLKNRIMIVFCKYPKVLRMVSQVLNLLKIRPH
ncbi:glycosyltransferase family 2 protein [Deefgea rivuli]|uniref:glycosyltransferase family 2 protein n=1 Tax=Deefgea rivuli TaxID=400948 RepID=UPI0006865899|nr:glycosyltransferase family 2 protein [Deefgea rivuli]